MTPTLPDPSYRPRRIPSLDKKVIDPLEIGARPDVVRAVQVLAAAILLVVTRVALIVLGFRRTATIVNRLSQNRGVRLDVGHPEVQAAKYAVSLAAAFVPARVLCLERSLVLYHQLKRKRISAVLRLGVRAYPFAAHAWVALDGSPLNETADHLKDFSPIFELS